MRRNFPPGCQDIPSKKGIKAQLVLSEKALPLTQLSWPTMLNRHCPVLTSQTLGFSCNLYFMWLISPSQTCLLNQRRGRAQCRWSCNTISGRKKITPVMSGGMEISHIRKGNQSFQEEGEEINGQVQPTYSCCLPLQPGLLPHWSPVIQVRARKWKNVVVGHLCCSLWSPGNTFYNMIVIPQLCLAILAASLIQNQVSIWFLWALPTIKH